MALSVEEPNAGIGFPDTQQKVPPIGLIEVNSSVRNVYVKQMSVVVIYSVDSSLPREVILAFTAGLAIGKLVGSTVNEVSEIRHNGTRWVS